MSGLLVSGLLVIGLLVSGLLVSGLLVWVPVIHPQIARFLVDAAIAIAILISH